MSSDLFDPAPTATAVDVVQVDATPAHPAAEIGEEYTAAEVDAAVAALGQPGALAHAQEVVTHAAPALEHLLGAALHEGGWFGSAYEAEVTRAAAEPDAGAREHTVGTLVAEQTRLGMFVGVAVGFELARELQRRRENDLSTNPATPTEE
jgi:hypothetical protein